MEHDRMSQNDRRSRAIGALLAGAIGDALGWPQEQNAGNVDRKGGGKSTPRLEFQAWTRYSGGRFYPHHESIGPGEYSDDTQLTLAVARSLLRGTDWQSWLSGIELPQLSLYERGAGRALKKASASWLRGRAPWEAPKRDDVKSYFGAGGNGAAMRVAPHCLRVFERDVRDVLTDVIRDSICTHGHPRAMVGASLQAYAISSLLLRQDTLGYGELVAEALAGVDVWGAPDLVEQLPEEWLQQYATTIGTPPHDAWTKTVSEQIELLKVAAKGLEEGPLADDAATLLELGCFDKAVNGAGTVSAAGAIFIASKAAANPPAGLLEAAFMQNADTDTMASMTGSLLGALRGIDWVGDLRDGVQDAAYFASIVDAIVGGIVDESGSVPDRVTQRLLDRFSSELEEAEAGGAAWSGVLPDGRAAAVVRPLPADALSPKFEVKGWVLEVEDGQSLFIKRLKRTRTVEPSAAIDVKVSRLGVKVLATDLQASRDFYEGVLGLKPARHEPNLVNYGEVLTIVGRHSGSPSAHQLGFEDVDGPVVVFLELSPIDAVFNRVRAAGGTILAPLGGRDRRFFRCCDPDGTVLEIREAL